MKILIIDDDFSATTTLKALLLSREKFDIDVAYAGKEGVEKMQAANPSYDVLILDIMMPDFSGMDVCKAMSQDEKLKKTPVILASALPITSKELGEMVDEFKALSVIKGVIEKPFVIDDLLDQIHKISG
jgi:DNA-binding response OmpR family regulator